MLAKIWDYFLWVPQLPRNISCLLKHAFQSWPCISLALQLMSSHKLSLSQLASTLYQSGPPMLWIAQLQLSAVILVRGGFWEPLSLHLQEHWAWKRHGTAPALVSPHHSNVGSSGAGDLSLNPQLLLGLGFREPHRLQLQGCWGFKKHEMEISTFVGNPNFLLLPQEATPKISGWWLGRNSCRVPCPELLS